MSKLKGMRPSGSMVVAVIALIAALGGTAFAAATITGKDIKNNSVASSKIKNQTLKTKDFSKKAKNALKGQAGPQGPKGDQGPQGPVGPSSPASYTNPNWGPIARNTIGSPVEDLRAGPTFGTGANQKPPLGVGSLGLEVNADPSSSTAWGTEKASFGNEVDFQGDLVNDLTALGFQVYTTEENEAKGNPNMPNIAIEIDPNLTATPSNFSTLSFLPPESQVKVWSPYIDATTTPASPTGTGFILSGAAGNATGCKLASPCTFAGVKAALNDGGDPATIGSIAVTKGRDFAFQGAVDGLRVNGTVYNFEPFGVEEVPAG